MASIRKCILNATNFILLPHRTINLKCRNVFQQTSPFRYYSNAGNFKITVGTVLDDWNKKFAQHNIPEPTESIENILMHVLQTRKYTDVYKNKHKNLSLRQLKEIEKMAYLRMKRMPVQYIIGEWDFRDLTLKMRPPVFIPRPETEQLVDKVLEEMKSRKIENILEFCCGCGAISLALLKANDSLRVTAVDKSEEACELTKENAEFNKLADRLEVFVVDVRSEDLLQNFNGKKFDLIVGNPPYIPSKDLTDLPAEISNFEDHDALDGGVDGLNLIKPILEASSNLLISRGKIFLEVDPSHPNLLKEWLKENKNLYLNVLRTHMDVFNRERFIEIIKTS